MTNQRDLANERPSFAHTHTHTCRSLFVTVYSSYHLPRVRTLGNFGRSMKANEDIHSSVFLLPRLLQMEEVIARMQEEKNGIPIRTVKSFLTKIPSVFSGKASVAPPLLSFLPAGCCHRSILVKQCQNTVCMACTTPAAPAVICISICLGCLREKNLA